MGARHIRLGKMLLAGGLIAAALPGWAYAQAPETPGEVTPEAETDTPQAEADSGAIIVTARRRAEALQDVPLAVNAFTGEFLERRGANEITQLEQFTPGLLIGISSSSNAGGIFIRGVGSFSTQALQEQGIGLNFDGVQLSTATLLSTSQLDLAGVEVLRGPQALYFGKNSPGGLIAFRAAVPGPNLEAMVRVGYEFDAREYSTEGMVSGPLTDNLGARLAVRYARQQGPLIIQTVDQPVVTANGTALPYPDDRALETQDITLRGTLRYQSDSRGFEAVARILFNRVSGDGSNGMGSQLTNCALGVPQILGVAQPAFAGVDCVANNTTGQGAIPASVLAVLPSFYNNDPTGFRRDTQWLASLNMNLDLGSGLKLSSISGFYSLRTAGGPGVYSNIPLALVISGNPYTIDQYSQELRLSSEWDGPFNFMVAAYYEHGRKNSEVQPYILALRANEVFIEQSDAYSVFAQAQWRFAPGFELSGGFRYTREVRDATIRFNGTTLTGVADDHISNGDLSPEVTLSWRPSQEVMLFASYRHGFKSAGFDGGYGTGARINADRNLDFTYNPEEIQGVEGGVRMTLAGGALFLNLTGYYYDYKNLQLGVWDPTRLATVTTNAAGSTIQGLEAEISWQPRGTGFSLRSFLAYNDSEYDEFIASCYVGQTIAMGCNLNPNGAGVFQSRDLTGARLSYAPRFTAFLGLYYEFAIGGLRLGLSSDTSYVGGTTFQANQSPGSYQDEYIKTDFSVRLFDPRRGWELSAVGRNLTNQYTLNRTIDASLTGTGTGTNGPAILADTGSFVSRGRQLLLQATYRY